ncbi:hypothetical protein AQ949_07060 [Burkholderia pseudomallei]|nr:hypothetical protein AQ786_00325 [Burkholderia pseudomallei]OMV19996.1 hypothetical protein AQ789_04905 [Burkholderia pseudomallei]ONE27173.1 hypothetical protein AQ949_07060 [Burkholderia pseudomallei]ONE48024.1 hypothetical protein AQ950_26910 [Burkholderia pseudomallei]
MHVLGIRLDGTIVFDSMGLLIDLEFWRTVCVWQRATSSKKQHFAISTCLSSRTTTCSGLFLL